MLILIVVLIGIFYSMTIYYESVYRNEFAQYVSRTLPAELIEMSEQELREVMTNKVRVGQHYLANDFYREYKTVVDEAGILAYKKLDKFINLDVVDTDVEVNLKPAFLEYIVEMFFPETYNNTGSGIFGMDAFVSAKSVAIARYENGEAQVTYHAYMRWSDNQGWNDPGIKISVRK